MIRTTMNTMAITETTMNSMGVLFLAKTSSTGMNVIMSWHLWAASATIDLDRATLEALAAILDDIIMVWGGMEETPDLEEGLMGMEVTSSVHMGRVVIRNICLGILPVTIPLGREWIAEIWDRFYDD